MLFASTPLAATVAELKQSEHTLGKQIDRVCDHIDQAEPSIHALLPEPGRRARLHQEAEALEVAWPARAERPPLFGALVGVKDIFHVAGFETRAGTTVPPATFAGPEAAAVALLKQAGALILGKTVTTEFAYFEPGPTANPHNLEHTPGGSSSGSAAAVAAGFCHLALGTQTIGSVIRPAAFCGVYGFKPTYDRIPTAGLVYFSRTADHIGIFTQDAAGIELAASVLCDEWRPITMGEDEVPILGVPDGPFLRQASPAALAAFERQLAVLEAAGYTVWRVPTLLDIEALNALHRRLVFAEFAREHAERYPRYQDHYRPRTREIIELGRDVSDGELASLREHVEVFNDRLEVQMRQAQIDLWVCPSALGPAPFGLQATGDPAMNLPWTHAGMPVLSVPAGTVGDQRLPVGLQLVAERDQDEALVAWGQLIAADLGARQHTNVADW